MVMNFWEAQRRARSRTGLYVTLFIVMTLIVAVLAELAMREFAGQSYNPPLPLIALVFMAMTFLVAGWEYMMYQSYGGSYVAESLGALAVDPQTKDPYERQLLNIVEEMAVASSLPIPKVYVLEANEINAFAAGLTSDKSAITVTGGSLNLLTRDELQGVIAHEFGHIYNGDMKISMRIAAMVMGFFFVIYIAFRLLQFSGMSRRRDNGENRGNPLALAGIILLVAGSITWLAGSILKSTISREREYLADACAVQFTRSPNGIANALRKIRNQMNRDMPQSGLAYSHLYFDNEGGWGALFASHPPIEKRIAAIEGREYMPEEWKI